jgi:hypothetical protein
LWWLVSVSSLSMMRDIRCYIGRTQPIEATGAIAIAIAASNHAIAAVVVMKALRGIAMS